MRGLAEMLGDGLNIIQQCEISDIAVIDAQFQLTDTKAQHYQACHLLVTSPAPRQPGLSGHFQMRLPALQNRHAITRAGP